MGSPDSGGYIKFTPKYIIVGAEGVVSEFILRLQSFCFGNWGPHAKFWKTPSGRKVKFTHKYIIVGGVPEIV